jgi:hypothetical protein
MSDRQCGSRQRESESEFKSKVKNGRRSRYFRGRAFTGPRIVLRRSRCSIPELRTELTLQCLIGCGGVRWAGTQGHRRLSECGAKSEGGYAVGCPIVERERSREEVHSCADRRRLRIVDTHVLVDGAKMKSRVVGIRKSEVLDDQVKWVGVGAGLGPCHDTLYCL